MKSIMEEASTIFKAVEKAWIRAEKPQSFTVKVLEEPVKNFIGMTIKSAKIALYFEEVQIQKPKPVPTQPQRKPAPTPVQQPQQAKKQPQKVQEREPKKQPLVEKKSEMTFSAAWSTHMSQEAEKWVKGVVSAMEKDVTFNTSSKNNQLIFEFSGPLTDTGRDRLLFGSLAHLLMQSIRHQFKNEARGLKVLLTYKK